MTCRDLPYYKGIRAKTRREHKHHENKHENHTNPLSYSNRAVIVGVGRYLGISSKKGIFGYQWGSPKNTKCPI